MLQQTYGVEKIELLPLHVSEEVPSLFGRNLRDLKVPLSPLTAAMQQHLVGFVWHGKG